MSLTTIAIASGKGGVGKTTLAIALAQVAGWPLLDADPQGSAVSWSQIRETASPPVSAVPLALLPDAMAQHPQAIIDAPGALVSDLALTLAKADLVIIPTSDAFLELDALPASVGMVRDAGGSPLVVLNRINPRVSVDALVAELADALQTTVAPVVVRERASHRRAISHGRTALEAEPTSPAANDIRALWAWLQQQGGR